MTIVEMLKNPDIYGVRVSQGNKWLFYDEGKFFVMEHEPYARKTKIRIETENEEKAVDALLEE